MSIVRPTRRSSIVSYFAKGKANGIYKIEVRERAIVLDRNKYSFQYFFTT